MQYAPDERALLRISKLDKKTIVLLAEGVHLESSTSRTISDLHHQACSDRLVLAHDLLSTGNKLMRTRPPQYRSAISRYYYCMYHSVRAVVYFVHGGDDYQPHSELPTQLPADFADSALWRNALKDARSHRNDADYDPYPSNPGSWRSVAIDTATNAQRLLAESEQYLKSKGCAYI
jgi:uncharacterized protein (UPF0332 family)